MKNIKYLASVTKVTTFYFLKILYEIKDNKIRKIGDKEIILQNNNTLKLISSPDYEEKNKKNEEILKDKFVILDLSNKSEFKEENTREVDENTAKYVYFLNQALLEPTSNYFYQIIDLTTKYSTENELRHSEIKIPMFEKPILNKSYIKYDKNILGPLKAEELNGECYLVSESTEKKCLRKYQIKKMEKNIVKVTAFDTFYGQTDYEFLYENDEMLIYDGFVDFISKEDLLKLYFSAIKENKYLTEEELDNISKKLKTKNLFSEYKAERETFIKEIFSINSTYDKLKKELIEIILKSEKNREELFKELQKKYPEKFNAIQVEEITSLKKKTTKSKITNEEKLLENKEALTKEINILNKDKETLVKELNKYNKNKENLDKVIKDSNKSLKEMTQKIKELEVDTNKLVTTKQNKELEIIKLNEEANELRNSNKNKVLELDILEKNIKSLRKELEKYEDKNKEEYKELLNNTIEKIKESYSRKKFDDFTLKAINELMNTTKKIKSEIKDKQVTNYPIVEKKVTEEEFIDFLYEFINSTAKRKISRNEVINIILCLSQGFLTIFAGEPGTGKTSLCNILGKALGLFKEENSRYLEVSIEKGWTSKRDFIGYYNPLSQKFDSMNKIVFDGFELLDKEKKNKNEIYPFIITLDEANLSPMEYYWADFMNNCDLENEYRIINMGENYIYNLPKNLRFLATINYDHTTEVLSPRLIDRAWIILLENNSIDINNFININIPAKEEIIKYEILEKFINIDNLELDKTSVEILTKVINCIKESGASISPRVLKMIKNYCVIGNKYFEILENNYIALDYAISQKLLPLLEGYGTEYEKFLTKLKNIVEKELPRTSHLLENIIIKGNNNMKHFNFFCK